jgi:hypothetical protein
MQDISDRRCAMRHPKGFTFIAAVIGALAVSSGALAGGGVTGTYSTTITKSNHLNGKWVFVLGTGGIYTVKQNGFTLVRGSYAVTATTITFAREKASGCTGAGTYAWKKSGRTMTFVRKREAASCGARAEILGHRFTQAGSEGKR